MPRLILFAALLLLAGQACAHGGSHAIEDGPPQWTWDPSVTLPLALTLLCYGIGLYRLLGRAGPGKAALRRSAALFGAGWLILAVAVVSPLHEAGERSFTLHMIEHEMIMLLAAPLLAAARPLGVMLWAFPRPVRQRAGAIDRTGWIAAGWRFLTRPVVATALQAAAMWLWHAPPLFDRALGHAGWHVAQHLSFLVTALLFWWAMFRTADHGLAALCLFVTSVVGGALGALMALSSSPWYAGYAAMGMMPFGLTPVEDQELAGLIMWVPGGLVHAGAALLLLARYLAPSRGNSRLPPGLPG